MFELEARANDVGYSVTLRINGRAFAAGKAYKGTKFSVGIGSRGTRTFLVFAETKEEAKGLALEAFRASGHQNYDISKINCRNVTNCKKYN